MNILRHVLQILLLVSLSTQALGATDCNCGWRSQGVLISAEKGDPPTTSDMRQLRNDLNYVKKNYVDSWRTDQGAFRFEMQFLRLADTIPIIGGLGLGNDLKDWQIEQLDKQLAAWTAYGLQKIKSEGKLKLTSPKDLADALLGPSSPFKDEPQIVRERVADFIAKSHAQNITELQTQLQTMTMGMKAGDRLTGQKLKELESLTSKLEDKLKNLEKDVKASGDKLEPTLEQQAVSVLQTASLNAQAIATLFPNDKKIQQTASFVAQGAQFAMYAILASGSGGAAYALPAIASGMALLKGGSGASSSKAILAAIRRLEAIINSNFNQVNSKLDILYDQLIYQTSLMKYSALKDLWQCGEILGSNSIGSYLIDNSRLYRVSIGPAFRTDESFRSVFGKTDERLQLCKTGILNNFTNNGPAPVFYLNVADDSNWILEPGVSVSESERKDIATYLSDQLSDTLSAIRPLLGPRALNGLSMPAARTLKELEAKISFLDKVKDDQLIDFKDSEISTPLNPGLVARAVGYVIALHNTFILAAKGIYDPKQLGSVSSVKGAVKSANYLAERTGMQQRAVVGDISLPLVAIVYRSIQIEPENSTAFLRWVQGGWLPKNFPIGADADSKARYRTIRENLLVAISKNRQLRENILLWQVREDLANRDMVNRTKIALEKNMFPLLPTAWITDLRVRWRSADPKAKIESGWVYTFYGASESGKGTNRRITYITAELPLPDQARLLSGSLWVTPSVRYLEDLEVASRRELASYTFYETEAAKNPSLRTAVERLQASNIDPLLLID